MNEIIAPQVGLVIREGICTNLLRTFQRPLEKGKQLMGRMRSTMRIEK